jgi:hypothetical protein
VILISTHAEDDFGGLIAPSPAIGFLPKAALSASAIRDMIANSGHLTSADEIRGPTGS